MHDRHALYGGKFKPDLLNSFGRSNARFDKVMADLRKPNSPVELFPHQLPRVSVSGLRGDGIVTVDRNIYMTPKTPLSESPSYAEAVEKMNVAVRAEHARLLEAGIVDSTVVPLSSFVPGKGESARIFIPHIVIPETTALPKAAIEALGLSDIEGIKGRRGRKVVARTVLHILPTNWKALEQLQRFDGGNDPAWSITLDTPKDLQRLSR